MNMNISTSRFISWIEHTLNGGKFIVVSIRKGLQQRLSRSSHRDQTQPSTERIHLRVRLPISSDHPTPRIFDVKIPSSMTSGELKTYLAKKFNKNRDKWEIVVSGGKEGPEVLDENRTLTEFSSDKTKRLYFYPGIF